MNAEERRAKLEERKQRYYSLGWKLEGIRREVVDIEKTRCNSYAMQMLVLAIDLTKRQVDADYSRYEKRINSMSHKEDLQVTQKALNREKAKNKDLEEKIKEATTSSGLFIKFVREKLGV